MARNLRDIVVMGGAANVGNATASAEFNVFHDPEAAAITLDAAADLGVAVTLYGLDVFYEPTVTAAQARVLAGREHPAARLAGLLIGFQCERFGDPATIGDAGAVCAVLEPGALRTERLPVRVELGGSWSRGRTVVDRRSWAADMSHDPHGRSPVELDVALRSTAPGMRRCGSTRSGRRTGPPLIGRVVVVGLYLRVIGTDVEAIPRARGTAEGQAHPPSGSPAAWRRPGAGRAAGGSVGPPGRGGRRRRRRTRVRGAAGAGGIETRLQVVAPRSRPGSLVVMSGGRRGVPPCSSRGPA